MINFQEIITSIILLVISLAVTNAINKFYYDYLFKKSLQWEIKNYYKLQFIELFWISVALYYFISLTLYMERSSLENNNLYAHLLIIALFAILISHKGVKLCELIKIRDKIINKIFCGLTLVLIIIDFLIIYFSYIANFIFKNGNNFEGNLGIVAAIMIFYFFLYGLIIFLLIIQKKIKTNKCTVYYGDNEKFNADEIRSQGDYIYVHNKEKDKRLVINKSVVKSIEIEKSDEIKEAEQENKRKYNI